MFTCWHTVVLKTKSVWFCSGLGYPHWSTFVHIWFLQSRHTVLLKPLKEKCVDKRENLHSEEETVPNTASCERKQRDKDLSSFRLDHWCLRPTADLHPPVPGVCLPCRALAPGYLLESSLRKQPWLDEHSQTCHTEKEECIKYIYKLNMHQCEEQAVLQSA